MAQQNRIDYLDGMRGLAILTVIAYHYFAQIHGVAISNFYNLHTPLYYGYLSVPLFFVISGYVIFMTLDKTPGLSGFLVRRWIRLFPAMLIASLAIPVIAYWFTYRFGGMPHLIDVVPGLTFLGSNIVAALTGKPTDGLEGGFWTVYVEVRFYVMFGLCYYVLGKKKAFYVMTALSFALFLLLQIAPLLGGNNVERMQNLFGKMLIGYHLPWFLLGMYVYLFNFQTQRILLLLIAGNALAFNLSSVGSAVATLILMALIFGAFTTSAVQAFFRTRVLLFFGFISYPLYLFNDSIGRGIVLALYENFSEISGVHIPFEVFPFIALGIVVPPVWCVAKYLEPAIQRWLKQRLLVSRAPKVATASLEQG